MITNKITNSKTQHFWQSLLRNKLLLIGSISGLVLLSGGTIWWLTQSSKNGQSAANLAVASSNANPIQVKTAITRQQGVNNLRVLTGSVEPLETVTLTSRVMGQIRSLNVQEGDRVKAGDVIVEIDVAEIQAQGNQALAGVSMAQSNYQNAEARLQQSIGQLIEIESDLAEAKLEQGRMSRLQKEGAVSQQLLDQANTRVKMSQARLQQTQAMIGQSQATMNQAQAQVSQAQSQVSQVVANLDYGTITAPFDGVVTHKHTEVGAMAGPSQPLVKIESSDRLRFSTQVPESMISQIRTGQKVSILIDALNRDVTGTVSHIIPSADPTTRNFTVKVTLNGTTGVISGMFGRLKLTNPAVAQKTSDRQVLMIPKNAIVQQFGITGVYKVVAGQANFQPITTGRINGEVIEVFSGLTDGEQLVLQPSPDLKNGTAVQVN
ncbi:efflux RND transporter periplasmic adaptor subunit [Pseudanabaena galeata UHCC 0370]|uniref:Efflux RND transporter periplasmic adaptor subunit n=1 Tax=Pseudanabaena galeata UHCC 0370 TaxID=3110310 RepID=A0ABU5TQV1_9CYAN|nr:efflux RND transporter periplasmic adaptor subunit [Pseudanabaena galeata]MEA5480654.1 efflux RND transporter periplasmic adaptor subunit [Pseudanabaena galeata UHCC 0370]